MDTWRRILFASLIVAVPSAPLAGTPWAVRVEAGKADYSRQSFSSGSFHASELVLDGGDSLSLAGEYRPAPIVGLELSLSRIRLDAESRHYEIRGVGQPPRGVSVLVASDSGHFSLQPLAATVLFHPLRSARHDLYFGPQVAWVSYDVGLEGPPDREAEPAIGAKLGWEWQSRRSPWSAGLAYRYLDVQHEGMERDQYTGLGLHLLSIVFSFHSGTPH